MSKRWSSGHTLKHHESKEIPMRAITQSEFGDPAQVLHVTEVPLPEPGPGRVRVRTVLAPIHNHDLWTVKGDYGFKPDLPARAGTEAVGVVDALGAGVDGLRVGQRVVTGGTFGTWAEYFLSAPGALIPVPDEIGDEAAAQLFAMPFSAITLLDYLDVRAGDWVLQNTANGLVSRLLAQLAAARGVHVVGLVRRAEAVSELAAQGITNVVSTSAEGWQDRARELAGDTGFAAAIDSVGGSASGELAELLRDRGLLVSFGAMSASAAGQSANLEIPVNTVIFKQLVIKGFWGKVVGQEMAADKRRELIGEVLRGVATGALTLPVEQIFGFDEIAEAATANGRRGRVGKVLLRP
jgi:NADPH2:quinone reductase